MGARTDTRIRRILVAAVVTASAVIGALALLPSAGAQQQSIDLCAKEGTLDLPGGGKCAGDEFQGKQPCGVHRPRQGNLPGRHRLKAEPPVIGDVADQKHEAEAFGAGPRQSFLDERPAEALAFLDRVDDERPEQRRPLLSADPDRRETDASHQSLVEKPTEAKRADRRNAFAHPVGAPGKPARTESLGGQLRQHLRVAIGFEADLKA